MTDRELYVSTRNDEDRVSPSEAIVKGLSDDGGLYVPEFIDNINFNLEELMALDYVELTERILEAFLPDFSKEEIRECIKEAYESGAFDTEELIKIVKSGENFYTELWHGPTAAFKDMALTLLPHLLRYASEKTGEERKIVILTATSGDTGKAALEGFKDVENTEIITFYPKDGVSAAQEKQMVTTEGDNTHVISVRGNFDDTQNGVKEIFNDKDFNLELGKKGFILSSANSINIGRLLPQIVYYYYAYFRLIERGEIALGEPVDFIVPSGNFGDILAGYYAKKSGLPVEKLICASNINKVLTDFFKTGKYDINREFYKTMSPSMDILISSNLERLLYDKLGRDSKKIVSLMEDLSEEGRFETTEAFSDFLAEFANEEEVLAAIKEEFDRGYLIDPHTAVGASVAKKIQGERPKIILSTANPYKFSTSVLKALSDEVSVESFLDQERLENLTGVDVPKPLVGLESREVRHKETCEREDMKEAVKSALGVTDA